MAEQPKPIVDCDPDQIKKTEETGKESMYEVFDEIAENNDKIEGRIDQLKEYDSDSLMCIKTLYKEGMSSELAAKGMAGNDTSEAHEFRRQLLEKAEESVQKGGDDKKMGEKLKSSVAYGLAACFSEEANAMREKLYEEGSKWDVINGLTGVEGKRADALREEYYKKGVGTSSMGLTLIGVDSEVAWNLREKMLKDRGRKGDVLLSLAGLTSEKAQKMREKLEGDAEKMIILESLAGDKRPESYKKRERLMLSESTSGSHNETRAHDLMVSIAGDDSPEANKLREQYWGDGKKENMHVVAQSLVGINSGRAWEMRKAMIMAGREDLVVESLAGGSILPGPEMLPLIRKNQELAADNKNTLEQLTQGKEQAETKATANKEKAAEIKKGLLSGWADKLRGK